MHSWDWHESVLLHAPMDQSSLIFDYCEGALDLVPLTKMVMKFLALFFAENQKSAHVGWCWKRYREVSVLNAMIWTTPSPRQQQEDYEYVMLVRLTSR